MPSSPRTRTHRRRPSSIDVSRSVPGISSNTSSPIRHTHSRRSSQQSILTPGANGIPQSFGMSSGLDHSDNGLGSLADELADAWEEDEELGGQQSLADQLEEGEEEDDQDLSRRAGDVVRDSGIDVASSPAAVTAKPTPESTPISKKQKHRRKPSQLGLSEPDDSSADDTGSILSSLEARMAAIGTLSRQDPDKTGKDSDGVIKRVMEGLKNFGSQSGVEGGATRLITAHSALSTHLSNQTRAVHSLTFPLLSPLSIPPPTEAIDELLPLLAATISLIPNPTSIALTSLDEFSALSADFIAHLSILSDTLHMSRQTTTAAARRLKGVIELVRELKKEEEEREEGIRWIEKGGWDKRLASRECQTVCGDVVGGFEEVCNGWRDRLVEGLGAA